MFCGSIWRNPGVGPRGRVREDDGRAARDQRKRQHLMTSWNCRGLLAVYHTSKHYIMAEGSKILVLSEHWLWPYGLSKLNQINAEYDAVGKADNRLSEVAEGLVEWGFSRPPVMRSTAHEINSHLINSMLEHVAT